VPNLPLKSKTWKKIEKQWLEQKDKEIRFICPVYFSANGFEPGIETWLHQQGVFTTDMERWETA
jgi:hypothetical protein